MWARPSSNDKAVLTPEMCVAAYEFLNTTRPFRRWKLPPADDVEFEVTNERSTFGWHQENRIAISDASNGHTATFLQSMAHEMIHLHQLIRKTGSPTGHNAEFHRLARQVCRHHGFDPKAF
jgi:predicted SprT family Zn-dependent metalloprotease